MLPNAKPISLQNFIVRRYEPSDDEQLLQMLEWQIANSNAWPSEPVRKNWDLREWLALNLNLSRWVAVNEEGTLVGHAGTSRIPTDRNADYWSTLLDFCPERLAEVSRLLVSPDCRRSGISGLLTRKCIRDTIEGGRIPVATSNPSSLGSLKMMQKFGWEIKGHHYSDVAKLDLIYLMPPQKLIDAALDRPLVG